MPFLGFTDETIKCYTSYLSNRKFIISMENAYSDKSSITCSVPQGSILGLLLFLIYINDMAQTVDIELLLCADDTCLVFQHRDIKTIEEHLNRDFSTLVDWFVHRNIKTDIFLWFVGNKLSVHFGEDKTKSILFFPNHRSKSIGQIDISYKVVKVKQYSKVTYLGCVLDECLSGGSMAVQVCTKVISKLKFLYRKNRFSSKELRRLLCNALIQPHFDYTCAAWYPNLNKKYKNKLQFLQNKFIRFCLQLNNREHIGTEHFDKINWLPIDRRFKQCLSESVFKFFSEMCPQ